MNIVLAQAYEYIPPPVHALISGVDDRDAQQDSTCPPSTTGGSPSVTASMTSRYMGLIVVPGEHIVQVQHEGPGIQKHKSTRDDLNAEVFDKKPCPAKSRTDTAGVQSQEVS